jgi:hypothetical protein
VAPAWKLAKTSPRTLVRTDLAASPSPPPPIWHPMTSSYFQKWSWICKDPVWYQCGDPGRIAETAWPSDRKGFPGNVPKMEETVGPVSTCGRELLGGWWRPIGFYGDFDDFTASVQNIFDKLSHIVQRNTWMSYHTVPHDAVRMNHNHCYTNLKKKHKYILTWNCSSLGLDTVS